MANRDARARRLERLRSTAAAAARRSMVEEEEVDDLEEDWRVAVGGSRLGLEGMLLRIPSSSSSRCCCSTGSSSSDASKRGKEADPAAAEQDGESACSARRTWRQRRERGERRCIARANDVIVRRMAAGSGGRGVEHGEAAEAPSRLAEQQHDGARGRDGNSDVDVALDDDDISEITQHTDHDEDERDDGGDDDKKRKPTVAELCEQMPELLRVAATRKSRDDGVDAMLSVRKSDSHGTSDTSAETESEDVIDIVRRDDCRPPAYVSSSSSSGGGGGRSCGGSGTVERVERPDDETSLSSLPPPPPPPRYNRRAGQVQNVRPPPPSNSAPADELRIEAHHRNSTVNLLPATTTTTGRSRSSGGAPTIEKAPLPPPTAPYSVTWMGSGHVAVHQLGHYAASRPHDEGRMTIATANAPCRVRPSWIDDDEEAPFDEG